MDNLHKLIQQPTQSVSLNSLKIRLDQYTNLLGRLEKVQQALNDEDLSDLPDELITLSEIEKPILFVKQYQLKKQWLSIPANSYISDQEQVTKWLGTKLTHPLNEEEYTASSSISENSSKLFNAQKTSSS